jgi:peptidoglycan/LPS O-acetylase OafA/YrhL
LAVLAVFAAHSSFGLITGGRIGVEVFFVLSGYLITTLLISEFRVSIRHFYLRRAARLLPALVVLTLIVIAIHARDRPSIQTSTLLRLIKVWLYVGNWFEAADPASFGLLGHTWSLAIE